MASLQLFPSVFPISPCLHSAGPAVLPEVPGLIPQPLVVVDMWQGLLEKPRGSSTNTAFLPALLRVGPELAAFLQHRGCVSACFYC